MNSKHIVFICRNNIESIPTILNSIFILSEMGHRISVISTFIDDNIRYSRNQPQLYGTMTVIISNGTEGINSVIYENPEELNVRRRAAGLCTIHLELWSEAKELPESLKGVKFK